VIFVIVYFFSPFDLIPDSLGLIGYIDDFSLFGGLLVWVATKFFGNFRDRVEEDYDTLIHLYGQ
jgi:uncharacterized membrane protein YkvA (DUF1232 family)